jgi:hypothetical protein
MATGAVFSLISNDGKMDRMLMATALLNKRLRLIEEARAGDQQVQDPTPTLIDIERTHLLFVNAHFKPFAALGYEYNKVNSVNTGTLTGVGQLQFSIAQFGDFFADMAVYVKLTVPSGFITYSSGYDPSVAAGAENAPAIRWCSYPGERLFKRVSFDVNGNPLDAYTREVYNFHREFCVQPNKEAGWNRLVGQENPQEGFLRQPGIDMTATSTSTSGIANTGLVPQGYRVRQQICTGNQTPKQTLSDLEVLVPLLLWFNLDPRLSVPSVSIPHGQRYITIDLASQNELCGLVPRGSGTWASPGATLGSLSISAARLYTNNIFVNPEIHDIVLRRIGFTLVRVHRLQTINVTKDSDEQQLNQFKWPIETMYVGMKPTAQEAATTASSIYLDRWHAFSSKSIAAYRLTGVLGENVTTKSVTVSSFSSPTVTASGAHGLSAGDIVMFSHDVTDATNAGIAGHMHVVLATNLASTTFDIYPATPAAVTADKIQVLGKPQVEAETTSGTFDRISITAHGIPLYNDFESLFFNSYQPVTYGGQNIRAPKDVGAVMICFNLYPGTYQPSSHINVSRAREFFLKWSSSVISSGNPGSLYALGIAINFLLVADGSAVLRYST